METGGKMGYTITCGQYAKRRLKGRFCVMRRQILLA